ncbi:hypothetical protein L0Y65_05685 [Candidatus Micrarchaeota archaeon]|nr:hypothetical protein [Candidatus Micrarchaeota archaeon]
MAGRVLSKQERRIIATHEANLRSVAEGFKDAIERDTMRAPQGMKEDAFSGMWNLSGIRKQIPEEVRSLEQYIYDFAPGRNDPELNDRLMRIALALYYLDKMDEFSDAVRKKGGLQLTSLFTVTRVRVEGLLDERFFSKTPRQILNDYLDAETALRSLSAACSIAVHTPYDAVVMYHERVCVMIGQATAAREALAG